MNSELENVTKMYCVFSKPALKAMNGVRGKMASQAGHAFLHAYWDSLEKFPDYAKKYKDSEYAYKITCVVETDLELEKLLAEFSDVCGTTEVVDAAFTVLDRPTRTCIGIGPIPDYAVDRLRDLKLLT